MKDLIGVDLYVGDMVAFVEPKTHNLKIGVVLNFTPKGCNVGYVGHMYQRKCNRQSCAVIKINLEDAS